MLAVSIYVDDLVTVKDIEEAAEEYYRQTLRIMKDMSMTLRKWNSNAKRLQEDLQKERI